ncbi:peptide deformylase [Gaetbulibacter aestuarii]|uniref:Peptide deformylase n=1 Tax=Gaetbulibacter aestuarii TaxID=1502358 RepID=A0ABW7N019_9FLAO
MKNILLFLLIGSFLVSCGSRKNMPSNGFSKAQTTLIMNADSLTPMRVFKITSTSDSMLLRTKSEPVKVFPNDPVLKNFVARLYATVTDSMSLGLGIAAPQVGILKNIIWVKRLDKDDLPFEVYLNPKIIEYSAEKQTAREGCLSIPGRSEVLDDRAEKIVVTYDTMEGTHKTETVGDFTAVIFQHEVDHLNGILYLDHLKKEIKDAKK